MPVRRPGGLGRLLRAVSRRRRLLDTFAALIAIALERVHFALVARDTLVKMEAERQRNSLLAALSHDLRTPITAFIGLAETLALELTAEQSPHQESLDAIRQQAVRMALLADNLLDMARLQVGGVLFHLHLAAGNATPAGHRGTPGIIMNVISEFPLTILIVEDEHAIRRFVRTALEGEGCQVWEADTVQHGLQEAGVRKPDLVILDLGLPDGDGVDFIRDLRAWSSMPVLVLSARIEEYDKVAALDAGA